MNPSTIFVVSDSTGNTAERVVRAALLQFERPGVRLQIWPRIRSAADITELVSHAAACHALLVHTLVNSELRQLLHAHAERSSVMSVDLFGTLLTSLSEFFEQPPQETPGASHRLDDAYFRRVEAMEFLVKADDGQYLPALDRADIVLVGVSRTSKTPVSAYLAGQGHKVANVPLVKGIEPPARLFSIPRGRVFALTIDPAKLHEVRQRRLEFLGFFSAGGYADVDEVFAEVRWALRLYRMRTNWPIIDITNMAVEETAAEILKQKSLIEAGT